MTTIASLVFSIIVYAIGYYGGNSLVENIYNKSGRIFKGIKKARKLCIKYDKAWMIIGRMIPFPRVYVSLMAGVCKHDFYIYVFISFIGMLFWNSIFIYLGFSFFVNLEYIIYIYHHCKMLILLIISASIVMILYMFIFSKKR